MSEVEALAPLRAMCYDTDTVTGHGVRATARTLPVWLQPGQIDDWMAATPDDAMAMLLVNEPPATEAYRVSLHVKKPRNKRDDLLEAVA